MRMDRTSRIANAQRCARNLANVASELAEAVRQEDWTTARELTSWIQSPLTTLRAEVRRLATEADTIVA